MAPANQVVLATVAERPWHGPRDEDTVVLEPNVVMMLPGPGVVKDEQGQGGKRGYSIGIRSPRSTLVFLRRSSRTPFVNEALEPSAVTSCGSGTTRVIMP